MRIIIIIEAARLRSGSQRLARSDNFRQPAVLRSAP